MVNDMLGGHIPTAIGTLGTMAPYIASASCRIAVSAHKGSRICRTCDVAEAGFPDASTSRGRAGDDGSGGTPAPSCRGREGSAHRIQSRPCKQFPGVRSGGHRQQLHRLPSQSRASGR